jgi:hypothetical protein
VNFQDEHVSRPHVSRILRFPSARDTHVTGSVTGFVTGTTPIRTNVYALCDGCDGLYGGCRYVSPKKGPALYHFCYATRSSRYAKGLNVRRV